MYKVKAGNWLRQVLKPITGTLRSDRIITTLRLRRTLGDTIKITEVVKVYQGDELIREMKGHIVSRGLYSIIGNLVSYGAASQRMMYRWVNKDYGKMRVGTGSGATTEGMTDLVTPDATAASTQAGQTACDGAGIYRISLIATWNAGVIAALDVTEIGLWLHGFGALIAFNQATNPTANQFCARVSTTDGDFSPFTIDIAKPLVIEWQWIWTFI